MAGIATLPHPISAGKTTAESSHTGVAKRLNNSKTIKAIYMKNKQGDGTHIVR